MDINSLYPYASLAFTYPVGSPLNIVNEERINTVKIINNKMYFESEEVTGLIRTKIIPPVTMIPFLIQRFNEKVFAVCCNECLKTDNKNVCFHPDDKRAILDTWTIPEICFAVTECGYRVVKIYELLIFK